MFRKGQNYRIFINGAIVAEETSCTVTRGVDTEEAGNKDWAADTSTGEITGSNPIPTYKNMTFQVEAQGAGAVTLFSTALALMNATGGAVGFAETSGSSQIGKYNRTGSPTYFLALCNDLTITAPNRQPVTCTAQFTVVPGTIPTPSAQTVPPATYPVLRGEFVRLFLGTAANNRVIAQATNCSLHLSLSLEDATTKDDESSASQSLGYKAQSPTQITYDITSDCIYAGTLTQLNEGTVYQWILGSASGSGQATLGSTIASGKAMLTRLATNAPVNQNITCNGTFTGIGTLNDIEPEPDTDPEQT